MRNRYPLPHPLRDSVITTLGTIILGLAFAYLLAAFI